MDTAAPNFTTSKLNLRAAGSLSDTRDFRFTASARSPTNSACSTAAAISAEFSFPQPPRAGASSPIVDVTHEGMREIPAPEAETLNLPESRRNDARSHVASLTPGAEHSPAIQPTDRRARLTPTSSFRVNGVRIAARGGSWGMDDFRKARLPRTHSDAVFPAQSRRRPKHHPPLGWARAPKRPSSTSQMSTA